LGYILLGIPLGNAAMDRVVAGVGPAWESMTVVVAWSGSVNVCSTTEVGIEAKARDDSVRIHDRSELMEIDEA
jgi:hypothetical protein